MKKTLILAASLVVMCSMIGCSENEPSDSKKNSDIAESSSVSQVSEESSVKELQSSQQAEEKAAVSAAASEEEPVRAQGEDPFKGLEVQFDGISPYGNVSFNNSGCSKSVQENVEFTFDEEQSIANGNKIIVKAQIAENAPDPELDLLMTEKEYTVEGLPYYVEDFSKINCEALYDEAQQYMNAHYLDAYNINETVLNTNNTWSYHRIMGADFKTSFSSSVLFEGSSSSECDGTYQAVLKANYQPSFNKDDSYGLNKYNYFFRSYHNVYTMISGYGDDKGKTEDVDIYVYIWITNVVAYDNGDLKYDVTVQHLADDETEQAYFNAVSSLNEKYNIKVL